MIEHGVSYTKSEIAASMEVSLPTLGYYCNKKYFEALTKIGYRKKQKKLTPLQISFLKEKLGI